VMKREMITAYEFYQESIHWSLWTDGMKRAMSVPENFISASNKIIFLQNFPLWGCVCVCVCVCFFWGGGRGQVL
jgi:hypothetical protein